MPAKKPPIAEPTSWQFLLEEVPVTVLRTDEGTFKVICQFLPRWKTCETYEEAAAEVVTASHLGRRAVDLQQAVEAWMDPPPEPEAQPAT